MKSLTDKRKAVKTLLKDEEWSQWSNVKISDSCGVSESLVRTMKKESTSFKTKSKTKGKDGRTINTSNIGNNSKDVPDNVDSGTGEDSLFTLK